MSTSSAYAFSSPHSPLPHAPPQSTPRSTGPRHTPHTQASHLASRYLSSANQQIPRQSRHPCRSDESDATGRDSQHHESTLSSLLGSNPVMTNGFGAPLPTIGGAPGALRGGLGRGGPVAAERERSRSNAVVGVGSDGSAGGGGGSCVGEESEERRDERSRDGW